MPHFISMGSHFLLRPEKETRPHLDQIAKSLGQFSTLEHYADVTLHFPGKIRIQTNKIVLSQSSRLLHQIFNTDCVCANGYQPVTYDLLCPDFNPEAMQKILQILYQGRAYLDNESLFQEMLLILKDLEINIPLQTMKRNISKRYHDVFDSVVCLDSDDTLMEMSNDTAFFCKYCDKQFLTKSACEKHSFEHTATVDQLQSRITPYDQVETDLANDIEAEVISSIACNTNDLSNNIFSSQEILSIQGQNVELGAVSYELQEYETVPDTNSRSDLSFTAVDHTGPEKLISNVTSLPFATKSKPHSCPTCSKQYTNIGSLKKHQQNHSNPQQKTIDLNEPVESQTVSLDFSFDDSETPTALMEFQSNITSGDPKDNLTLSNSTLNTNSSEASKGKVNDLLTSRSPIPSNFLKRKLPTALNGPICKVSLSLMTPRAQGNKSISTKNLDDGIEETGQSDADIQCNETESQNILTAVEPKKKRGRPCKINLSKTPATEIVGKLQERPKQSRKYLTRGTKQSQRTLAESKHSGKYICVMCNKPSTSFANLLIHLSTAHYKESMKKMLGEDKNKCVKCSKVVRSQCSMFYHLATKHNALKQCMGKEYFLKVKELKFRKYSLSKYKKPDKESNKDSCNKKMASENTSQTDKATDNDNTAQAEPSAISQDKAQKAKIKIRRPKATYKCHLCNNISEHYNKFLSHMAVTHFQRELLPLFTQTDGECTLCQKVYSNKYVLLKHLANIHNAIDHLLKDVPKMSETTDTVTLQTKEQQLVEHSLSDVASSNSSPAETKPFMDKLVPYHAALTKKNEISIVQSSENNNSSTSLDQQTVVKRENMDYDCHICHKICPNFDLLLRHYSVIHFKEDLKKFYGKEVGECRLCTKIVLNEECLLQHLAVSHNALDKLIPDKASLMIYIKSEIENHNKDLDKAPKVPQITGKGLEEQTSANRTNSVLVHLEDTRTSKSVEHETNSDQDKAQLEKKTMYKLKIKVKTNKLTRVKTNKVPKQKFNKIKKQKLKKGENERTTRMLKCYGKKLKKSKLNQKSEDTTVYYCHMCPFQTSTYKKIPRHIGQVHLKHKVKEYYGSDKLSCSLCTETYTQEGFLIGHIISVHGVLNSLIPPQAEAAIKNSTT